MGVTALCTLLVAVPGLTHLDIGYGYLREQGTALLAPVLKNMTRLHTLNMRYCTIGDRGMALLAPALAALPHLHTLVLSNNRWGANAVPMLWPLLAREGSPLHKLDLSWQLEYIPRSRGTVFGVRAEQRKTAARSHP